MNEHASFKTTRREPRRVHVRFSSNETDLTEAKLEGLREFRKVATVVALKIPFAFCVRSKEGLMHGKPGDWLAIGAEGERYIIDAGIFEKTYEEVVRTEKG